MGNSVRPFHGDVRQHHRGGEHGRQPWGPMPRTFVSQGYNLIGETDGSSGWVGSDLTGTIASPLNPMLAPLGTYGGPTQTMALYPVARPSTRAVTRWFSPETRPTSAVSRIVNKTLDIGAFESSGSTIAVTSGSGQAEGGWPTSSAFTAPLVVTVTAKNSEEPVAGGLVTFTPPGTERRRPDAAARRPSVPAAGRASRAEERCRRQFAVSATVSGTRSRPRSN